MSEQMSDKVWKQREVEGLGLIQVYEEGRTVVATLQGANHPRTKKAAALIVAAPKLLKMCQAVLREHKQGEGVPQEILEEMLTVVMNAQPFLG